jgi:hypothetical protein
VVPQAIADVDKPAGTGRLLPADNIGNQFAEQHFHSGFACGRMLRHATGTGRNRKGESVIRYGRIVILNAIPHQSRLYGSPRRSAKRVKIRSSPAVFAGFLPFVAIDFP